MTKEKLISAIIAESKIHHNISTNSLKLPDAPDGAPDNIFWDTCGDLISLFIENWRNNPRNDSGNRNLCDCRKTKPQNIRSDGACQEHDLYRIYSHGRSGATLYWSKYWSESNTRGVYFRGEDDLEEMENGELETILDDLQAYNQAVAAMLKDLPEELFFRYSEKIENRGFLEWAKNQKEEKRREAMGYNRKLSELLESDNPAIVRLAKGIKKEIVK